MPVIGITGGIASGKTTFCRALAQRLNAEVFDSDACARRLLEEDSGVRREVRERVDPEAVNPQGTLDRGLLRRVIYSDPQKKKALESILHPRIRQTWLGRAREARAQGAVFFVDIPLLFETRAESHFDRIILVACRRETQHGRLCALRKMSPGLAEKMIASQMPVELKIPVSDHLVWNDGPPDVLLEQAGVLSYFLS